MSRPVSRRRRRRNLAAPFVVTTALGACGPSTTNAPPTAVESPAAQEQPKTYDQNGDEIDGDKPPVIVNPPAPGTLPDPPADGDGKVITRDDGTCWYYESIECPPNAKCNPPPPMQVTCPANDQD